MRGGRVRIGDRLTLYKRTLPPAPSRGWVGFVESKETEIAIEIVIEFQDPIAIENPTENP